MTNKQINTINRYFNSKNMDRKQLEAVLDFDNLTIDEKYIPEIMELLKSGEDEEFSRLFIEKADQPIALLHRLQYLGSQQPVSKHQAGAGFTFSAGFYQSLPHIPLPAP